jgi:hypothetical protein
MIHSPLYESIKLKYVPKGGGVVDNSFTKNDVLASESLSVDDGARASNKKKLRGANALSRRDELQANYSWPSIYEHCYFLLQIDVKN